MTSDRSLRQRTSGWRRTVPVAALSGAILDDAVFDDLDGAFPVVEARDVELKGIPGTHVVHAVDWAESVR